MFPKIDESDDDVLSKVVLFASEAGHGGKLVRALREAASGLNRFVRHLVAHITSPETLATASEDLAIELTSCAQKEQRRGRGLRPSPIIAVTNG